jgi:LytS/YehU family sensor histidine kinase
MVLLFVGFVLGVVAGWYRMRPFRLRGVYKLVIALGSGLVGVLTTALAEFVVALGIVTVAAITVTDVGAVPPVLAIVVVLGAVATSLYGIGRLASRGIDALIRFTPRVVIRRDACGGAGEP